MNTQVEHTSYTAKAGYIWRKRYDKNTLSISLQTKDAIEASRRSASMTMRFMQLELLKIEFGAVREAMKSYRDEIIKNEKLVRLQALVSQMDSQEAPEGSNHTQAVQSPNLSDRIAQIVLQEELEQTEGHSLEEAKATYFDAHSGDFIGAWTAKTIKDYSACIDRFIIWCAASNIHSVEAVSKDNIISFKQYMDEANLAPNTKQKILTRLGSMFKFIVDVKEWREKNPITGMMYKKVGVVNKKEEITPTQFNAAMEQNETRNDLQTSWAMYLLYHCGLRVSELSQLTKADYREIEGIKCISINTDHGKTVKNESSIRNIPLNETLIALGAWEQKPIMKYGDNRTMDRVSRAFKLIGLKRSTHCFRHSLSNRLRDTNATDSIRAYILGHTQANMTDRVYVTRDPLIQMKTALDTTGAMQ
ncbi:tyrosine-type recombinase/integrase [Klebsiella aerogenes]|uniref:tyrosine-type recombinase/integrase n=1 Tax=Klebsiella aerogenes TaxID=548 RepID=UPI002A344873|nr:tyrosine-type recombinase/integrase [Klebsiella aerogenes]